MNITIFSFSVTNLTDVCKNASHLHYFTNYKFKKKQQTKNTRHLRIIPVYFS